MGLPAELDLEGNALMAAAEVVDRLGAGAGALDRATLTFTELATRLEKWEIFGRETLPDEVAAATRLAWSPVPAGFYLSCGQRREARIRQDMLGVYRLQLTDDGRRWEHALACDPAAAVRAADRLVLDCWPEAGGLVLAAARWRQEPATGKQLAFLRTVGATHALPLPDSVLTTLTKGEAQQAIARVLGR
jgi:hypothetical protein